MIDVPENPKLKVNQLGSLKAVTDRFTQTLFDKLLLVELYP